MAETTAPALPCCYGVYGLTLESDTSFTLPAARPGENDQTILFTLNAAEVEAGLADLTLDANEPVHQIILANGGLYMRWQGLFDLLVSSDGARICCRNFSRCGFDYIEAYVMNYAVSAALLQQGEETLHATVVDINGCVIGLLGTSGAGKSTLASFLRTIGGEIVTDDVLRICISQGMALAYPGPHRLKLFPEAARRFLPDASPSSRWSPMRDKSVFDLGVAGAARAPRHLNALYHLRSPETEKDGLIVVTRLGGRELFRTISASTMNNALQTPGRLLRHFRFVERLARVVPVYGLAYPRRFEALEDVADAIMRSALA